MHMIENSHQKYEVRLENLHVYNYNIPNYCSTYNIHVHCTCTYTYSVYVRVYHYAFVLTVDIHNVPNTGQVYDQQ